MTVDAARRHRIAPSGCRAVQAVGVRSGLGLVASTAIDELEFLGVSATPGTCQFRVTVHAGHARVDGCLAGVFGDENRDFLTPAVARQVGLRVAPQALLVFQGQRGIQGTEAEDRSDGEEPTLPMTTPE